ncbi:unnamed protein product [Moneuplotes crassus]|uniref:EamA domain-containing protein n=1 Tax=Euplotes crassus TaxID=5936 RepID=A0AAD1XH76_EUPCR|nr:unnamed protein product [Moneuplotes crassus]
MHKRFDENIDMQISNSLPDRKILFLQNGAGKSFSKRTSSVIEDIEDCTNEVNEPEADDTKRNYIIGFSIMLTAVLTLTLKHSLIKLMSFHSPYLSVYDIILFRGCIMVIFMTGIKVCITGNFFFSLCDKSHKQIPSLSRGALFFIFLRCALGVINYSSESYTVARLPLSKSTMMFSCSAITCAILAWVFLRERLGLTYILCLIGCTVGVYFLSLGKEDSHKEGGVSAYLAAVIAIWANGASVVASRQLNLYKVHFSTFGVSFGIHFVVIMVVCSLLFDDVFHFEMYTNYDIFMLTIHGITGTAFMIMYYVAAQYMQATYVGPLKNLEIIFTIFIDIFLFNYSFTGEDIIGMSILAICIAILLILKFI